jgi:hypothetical protein
VLQELVATAVGNQWVERTEALALSLRILNATSPASYSLTGLVLIHIQQRGCR